jgi:hypothetical protein
MVTIDGVELCTSAYAAEQLQMTVPSLYNAISAGRVKLVPAYSFGSAKLYRVSDVEREVARRR